MTRKQMSLLSGDELRELRHKYLAMVGTNVKEQDRIYRILLRIKQELFIRQSQ